MKNEENIKEKVTLCLLNMKEDPITILADSYSLELKIIKCLLLLSSMEKPSIDLAKDILSDINNTIIIDFKYKLYLEICNYWIDGKYKEVHKLLEELLYKYPNEIIAIYIIHMLEFYMGWTKQLLLTISKNLINFKNESNEIIGYLKGIESFSLEENGFYEKAFESAQIALKYNKDDIYAIHSMCHIFLEQGKYKEAIEYLENNIDRWTTNYGMRIHVWWHKAIFHLYLMDFEEVLYIYNEKLRNKNNTKGLEDLDATALLWRLQLLNIDVNKEFIEISNNWSLDISSNTYWFNTLHAFIAHLGTNNDKNIETILSNILNYNYFDKQTTETVEYAIKGFYNYYKKDYKESFKFFNKIINRSNLIGGSNAQRDILELTAISAGLRSEKIKVENINKLIEKGRVFEYDSKLKLFFKERIKNKELLSLFLNEDNSLDTIYDCLIKNNLLLEDEVLKKVIDTSYNNFNVNKFSIDKDTKQIKHLLIQDKIIYVIRGKVILLRINDSLLNLTNDNILNKMELINVGEPIILADNIPYIILPHLNEQSEYICFDGSDIQITNINKDLQKNINDALVLFDDYYTGYDERYKEIYSLGAELWETEEPNQSLKIVMDEFKNIFEENIIDLGCGEGRDSIYLGLTGYLVTGVDLSNVALNKGRLRASNHNLCNVSFVESDVIHLRNIKNDTYQMAMNMGCLHMLTKVEHRKRHISRVREILKDNGYFLVDHCQDNWGKNFFSIPNYDEVLPIFKVGNKIPRRIRVKDKYESVPLKVIPYTEKNSNDLINEITSIGFKVINVWITDTEAFGNSATILFQKV